MAGTVRESIAEKIKADNAGYIVKSYPASAPENLGANKVFVGVYRETLTNSPQTASVAHSLKIQVITPKKNTEAAENELEDALFQVLVSVASLNYVTWSTAQRGIFLDTFIGYEIDLEANTENIYKPSAT